MWEALDYRVSAAMQVHIAAEEMFVEFEKGTWCPFEAKNELLLYNSSFLITIRTYRCPK